jgi:hypothetical protein
MESEKSAAPGEEPAAADGGAPAAAKAGGGSEETVAIDKSELPPEPQPQNDQ